VHQVKAKAARKINYSEFLTALPLISDKKARHDVLKLALCGVSLFCGSGGLQAHVLMFCSIRRKSALMS
jgi:hypothetical protein